MNDVQLQRTATYIGIHVAYKAETVQNYCTHIVYDSTLQYYFLY